MIQSQYSNIQEPLKQLPIKFVPQIFPVEPEPISVPESGNPFNIRSDSSRAPVNKPVNYEELNKAAEDMTAQLN